MKPGKNRFFTLALFMALIIVAMVISGKAIYKKCGTVPDRGRINAFQEDKGGPLEAPFYPTIETISKVVSTEDKLKYLYSVDPTAYVLPEQLDLEGFLKLNLSTELTGDEPKILIFHTHSTESFADSRAGEPDDTVVGLGSLLAYILNVQYHIPVVHDVGNYDVVKGKEAREGSYERMSRGVEKILQKYPSIEITIDLHRDGVPDDVRLVHDINGVPTARMMFFNGVTCLNDNGVPKAMPDLPNPYLYDNLALSLQLQLAANELYPGLMRRIYIKPYRYSLYLEPKSILVEVGANTSTVAEAKNAMWPLAQILTAVLESKD